MRRRPVIDGTATPMGEFNEVTERVARAGIPEATGDVGMASRAGAQVLTAGTGVTLAFRHRSGGLLLLHRPRSRTAAWHDRIGVWIVTLDGAAVGRQCIYGRRVRSVPFRWAGQMLRAQATP